MKKIIYTANIGNYDHPKPLLDKYKDNWTALYFTDNKDLEVDGWEMVFVDKEKNQLPHNTAYARQIKLSPHIFLPEHDVSLWVDASKIVVNSLDGFILHIPKTPFVTAKHPKRNCVYEELIAPRVKKKISSSNRKKIYKKFIKEKMPVNFGLQETQFIIRHNTEENKKINELWWELMYKYNGYRDQIWLSYILYKLGIEVVCIPKTFEKHYFDKIKHGKK